MRCEILAAIAGIILLSGCATVSRDAGLREVSQAVEQRTGLQVRWNQGRSEDALAVEQLDTLLREALTPEAAVQIALLNNASLQAALEEMGIAQADLVQAGLLKNPVFAGHVRFPDKSGESTNAEFSVSQDFLDILFRPMRKKLAAAQFEQAGLRVSDAVLSLSAEVRSAYYTLQGAEHTRNMLQTVLEAAEAAGELARRQHAAGNINELELANSQAAEQQAMLEVTRIEAEVLAQRERLNRLMGLQEKPAWTLSAKLPELPPVEPPLGDLEEKALSQRLDLAAARQEVRVFEQTLALARRGMIPELNVGLDTEREPDGARLTGPAFEVPVPLFDRRQAGVARAEAQLRQARRRVASLETQVRSEVRSARDRLRLARDLIERYRGVVIPLKEKIVAESQKHYNFMLIGVFQLLDAKGEEVRAWREYIEAFSDYWDARTELERALGGRLEYSALNGGDLS